MYNKLFTKILDSSIWTESATTRIVWLTFIAAMDETGFVPFASVKNVAHRAIVSVEEAEAAVACLESPDVDSSDPENEGRRIERVTGGWIVLNAEKYRAIATREHQKELNRNRVANYRKRKSNGGVMPN
jgi:RNA polymerase-interacting CarD/CdnL/TRCF family regulator